eukprot:1146870-Pelagomonas_calceolata.AAC.3
MAEAPCVPSTKRKRENQWKGKGYIAVPAYVGSLAGAKKVPVTKPIRSGEQKHKIQPHNFKHADTNFANPRTSAW